MLQISKENCQKLPYSFVSYYIFIELADISKYTIKLNQIIINRIFEVLRSSQMTCYTFYFSLIRCDTLWYILTHPSKLGMLFTPYCTFLNLLKNSFQESNWKPIQKSVQKSICNSGWNFIPKSIQKMDIVNLKCKMA